MRFTQSLRNLPPGGFAGMSDADTLDLARTIAVSEGIIRNAPRHRAPMSLVGVGREAQARAGRPFFGRHMDITSYRALPTVAPDRQGMSA